MKRKTAFLDADILMHRAVSFVPREFDGEEMVDWKNAVFFFDWLFDKWMREVGKVSDWYLVVSPSKNFRHDLYPDYKGNRKDIEPHPAFARLKQEVLERIDTICEPNLEADDLIGIHCSADPKHTVAVSADKDFATVPCSLVIPTSHGATKPTKKTFSEKEADRNWMIQAMTGDNIDNYPGIYGVGPVKAAELYDNPHLTVKKPTEFYQRGANKGLPKPDAWVEGPPCSPWQSMVSFAQSKGMTEDDLVLQARLARILRHGDYDFETKEIKLWTPN